MDSALRRAAARVHRGCRVRMERVEAQAAMEAVLAGRAPADPMGLAMMASAAAGEEHSEAMTRTLLTAVTTIAPDG